MKKKDIEKLKSRLKKGDQQKISKLSGLSDVTVNKFFNGNEDTLTDDSITKIVIATKAVIDERNAQNEDNKRIIKSI